MRIPIAFLTCLVVSGVVARSAAAGEKADKPINIVLIVADDLGIGDVGCYGQTRIRTPNIDGLAASGMRFVNFHAGSPVCAPSRCALMTGKHGGHAHIRDNGNPTERRTSAEEDLFPGQHPIPDSEVTVAELLKAQGYATAGIGKWGLGFEGSSGDPERQGFDHFFGYLCQAHAHNHYPRFLWENGSKLHLEGNTHGPTGKHYAQDLFTEKAVGFLRDHRDGPFLLYLPFTIPHASVQVPEASLAEYEGKFGEDPPFVNDTGRGYVSHRAPRAGYAAMVSHLDRAVGRILDELKALNLEGQTLVLFTSDNGPTHDRVGGSDSAFFESAQGRRGLKGSVYQGGIAVPMIARLPGVVPAGTTGEFVGYFPDILPTLMDLAGASEAVPDDVDGISFLPALRGSTAQKAHDFLIWDFHGYGGQQAVRRGPWKAVRTGLAKARTMPPWELYNLDDDPTESRDLAAERPEIVKELDDLMRAERTPSKLFPCAILDGGA